MRVTIDKFGRIVIPKRIRQAMGIRGEAELELIEEHWGVRLEPVSPPARKVLMQNGLPVLEYIEGEVVTDDDIRRLRDELQR